MANSEKTPFLNAQPTSPYDQQPQGQAVYQQPPMTYAQPSMAPGYQVGVAQVAVPVVVSSHPPANSIHWQHHESPVQVQCPHCNSAVTTHPHYVDGTLTYVAAGVLCLVGCWLGCCLIPFCMEGCKDVEHKCPACHRVIGVKRRI